MRAYKLAFTLELSNIPLSDTIHFPLYQLPAANSPLPTPRYQPSHRHLIAMPMSQTKRHKAWLRYKLLSSDLFQQIEGRELHDIATWPVEERAEYHKFLITGLHRNRLCMEERMRYKLAYVPREKWDDEHERAIDWAKGNIVRFQSLLADLAVALQSVPQPPEPPQSDPELNAEVGAEPARPKSRGKRKAGKKKVMAKVDIILCFCFFVFVYGVPLTLHTRKVTGDAVDELEVIAVFDRMIAQEVQSSVDFIERRLITELGGLTLSVTELDELLSWLTESDLDGAVAVRDQRVRIVENVRELDAMDGGALRMLMITQLANRRKQKKFRNLMAEELPEWGKWPKLCVTHALSRSTPAVIKKAALLDILSAPVLDKSRTTMESDFHELLSLPTIVHYLDQLQNLSLFVDTVPSPSLKHLRADSCWKTSPAFCLAGIVPGNNGPTGEAPSMRLTSDIDLITSTTEDPIDVLPPLVFPPEDEMKDFLARPLDYLEPSMQYHLTGFWDNMVPVLFRWMSFEEVPFKLAILRPSSFLLQLCLNRPLCQKKILPDDDNKIIALQNIIKRCLLFLPAQVGAAKASSFRGELMMGQLRQATATEGRLPNYLEGLTTREDPHVVMHALIKGWEARWTEEEREWVIGTILRNRDIFRLASRYVRVVVVDEDGAKLENMPLREDGTIDSRFYMLRHDAFPRSVEAIGTSLDSAWLFVGFSRHGVYNEKMSRNTGLYMTVTEKTVYLFNRKDGKLTDAPHNWRDVLLETVEKMNARDRASMWENGVVWEMQ
jgi:hypothetical protein